MPQAASDRNRGKSEKKSGVPIMSKYDFIILGATGFTGRWVLEEEYVPFDLDIKRPEMTLLLLGT